MAFLLLFISTFSIVNVNAENSDACSEKADSDYPSVNYTYEWPMYRHDLNHTGYTESDAPDTNSVLWTASVAGEIMPSPTIVDGKVFIGSEDNSLYCFDATNGEKIWNFTAGGKIIGIAVVAKGRVYFGTYGYPMFYCLDKNTGELIWNITLGVYEPYTFGIGTDPIYHDGKIFVGGINEICISDFFTFPSYVCLYL